MSHSPSAEPRAGRDHDDQAPNLRPLGYLAVGCGVLSILMVPTFFLTLIAVPLALLALGLGLAARSEESIRQMGTTAVVLGLIAFLCATAILTLLTTGY